MVQFDGFQICSGVRCNTVTGSFHNVSTVPVSSLFYCSHVLLFFVSRIGGHEVSWQRLSFLFIVFLLLLCVMFVIIFLRVDSSGWCSLTGSKSVLAAGAIL